MNFALGIIKHTPLWVWPLLAYLIWQGIKAMGPRTTTIWRALIVPAVFIVWGLSRLGFGQQGSAAPLVAWIAAALLFLPVGILTPRPFEVDHDTGLIKRPGSVFPLIRNITVFATTHTAANHPVVVAKQLATIDRISRGRIGLNIVAGWNKPEYEALGLTLPDDHTTRYGYAQEWFDIVRALWSRTEAFDWDGAWFKLKNVLLTSATHDHINVFPTHAGYLAPFRTLLASLPADGLLVVSSEPHARALANNLACPVVHYSLDDRAHWHAARASRGVACGVRGAAQRGEAILPGRARPVLRHRFGVARDDSRGLTLTWPNTRS